MAAMPQYRQPFGPEESGKPVATYWSHHESNEGGGFRGFSGFIGLTVRPLKHLAGIL